MPPLHPQVKSKALAGSSTAYWDPITSLAEPLFLCLSECRIPPLSVSHGWHGKCLVHVGKSANLICTNVNGRVLSSKQGEEAHGSIPPGWLTPPQLPRGAG